MGLGCLAFYHHFKQALNFIHISVGYILLKKKTIDLFHQGKTCLNKKPTGYVWGGAMSEKQL